MTVRFTTAFEIQLTHVSTVFPPDSFSVDVGQVSTLAGLETGPRIPAGLQTGPRIDAELATGPRIAAGLQTGPRIDAELEIGPSIAGGLEVHG